MIEKTLFSRAVMFIPKQQNIDIIPQRMFQSQSNHLREEEKTGLSFLPIAVTL